MPASAEHAVLAPSRTMMLRDKMFQAIAITWPRAAGLSRPRSEQIELRTFFVFMMLLQPAVTSRSYQQSRLSRILKNIKRFAFSCRKVAKSTELACLLNVQKLCLTVLIEAKYQSKNNLEFSRQCIWIASVCKPNLAQLLFHLIWKINLLNLATKIKRNVHQNFDFHHRVAGCRQNDGGTRTEPRHGL